MRKIDFFLNSITLIMIITTSSITSNTLTAKAGLKISLEPIIANKAYYPSKQQREMRYLEYYDGQIVKKEKLTLEKYVY